MIVKVEIVYEDRARNKNVEVDVREGLRGVRLLNAVDKALAKLIGDDPDWTRWNLLDVRK